MLNILIPMCGKGQRFKDAGYVEPKPFMMVAGMTMIERVVKNLQFIVNDPTARFIFVTEDGLFEDIDTSPNPQVVVETKRPTKGAVDTLYCARQYVCTHDELIIANCDQIVDLHPNWWPIPVGKFGSVLTFDCPERSKAWSYVQEDIHGNIERIVEKDPISSQAVVGIYYFKQGWIPSDAALDILSMGDPMPNGEFYTSSIIQYMADKGHKIVPHYLPRKWVHMIGTPELLKEYERCL